MLPAQSAAGGAVHLRVGGVHPSFGGGQRSSPRRSGIFVLSAHAPPAAEVIRGQMVAHGVC